MRRRRHARPRGSRAATLARTRAARRRPASGPEAGRRARRRRARRRRAVDGGARVDPGGRPEAECRPGPVPADGNPDCVGAIGGHRRDHHVDCLAAPFIRPPRDADVPPGATAVGGEERRDVVRRIHHRVRHGGDRLGIVPLHRPNERRDQGLSLGLAPRSRRCAGEHRAARDRHDERGQREERSQGGARRAALAPARPHAHVSPRRRRSSSRRRRLLGRPSPLTAMIPGRTSTGTTGGLWST